MSILEDAYERFKSDPNGLYREIEAAGDPLLLRLAYERMLGLKGQRGIDDWREFLGHFVGMVHLIVLRGPLPAWCVEGDYQKADSLFRWWAGWRKSKGRAERVRDAGVPGEPRPTRAALIERDGRECWRCGEDCEVDQGQQYLEFDPETGRGVTRNPRYYTVGHVVRLIDGGRDTMDNAKLECWDCNAADGIPLLTAPPSRTTSSPALP